MAIIIDRHELAAMRAARPTASVDVYTLLNDAEQARRAGAFEEAERLLQQAVIVAPDRASVWSMIGSVEDELGEVTVAREAYRYALSLADDDVTALALARLHASVGEWDDALAVATHLALAGKKESMRDAATRLATEVRTRKGSSHA